MYYVCGETFVLRYTLTLNVLVTTTDALGHFLNSMITEQWEGMGDVGSARGKPALLRPCPTIRLSSYIQ